MTALIVLRMVKKKLKKRPKSCQGGLTVLQKMANYGEARDKITNAQLNNLTCTSKNKCGTTMRITKKTFQDENLPYELFLTAKQKPKIKNAFANNISTYISYA